MRKINFQRLILGIALASATALAACSGAQSLPGTSAANSAALAAATNAIKNGCFSGMTSWTMVKGKANGAVKVVTPGYGSCKGAMYAGTSAPPAPDGFYGVSQTVKVTAAGKLSFWFWGASNDQIKYGSQQVNVVVGGKIVDTCYKQLITNASTAWKLGTCNLKKYAGQTVQLQFGVYDNGYSKTYMDWYVSDISLQ